MKMPAGRGGFDVDSGCGQPAFAGLLERTDARIGPIRVQCCSLRRLIPVQLDRDGHRTAVSPR